ncbi:MAG: J domain-containing protein [Thermaerobacter sp.]|nr:J domain-containing protein [Thermaerobacter sp.]
MPGPKDYYKTLGVDDKADAKTIKNQFRRLARKYHPDVSGAGGEEKFKEINEAYEVLSDPKKRAEYDSLRRGFAARQARNQGSGFQRVSTDWDSGDFSEWGHLFEDLFGGAGGRTAARERAVPEETVQLTLEQVATGTVVALTVQDFKPCVVCHGQDPRCPRCQGAGQVAEPSRFDVTVPPGVEEGTLLRVGRHAQLKVSVLPHPRFVRQGADLRGQLMVAVPLAATGGELRVAPLLGEPVIVKIPVHTNHGKILRLKGLGLPVRGTRRVGDLLLEVVLRFPEPFAAADDRLYQELRGQHAETGGEVRAPR